MEHKQQYWESLKLKYEGKNRALEMREFELRQRLEAMQTIIGGKKDIPTTDNLGDYSTCSCAVPQEKGGFLKSVFSMFGSSNGKPKPVSPHEIPTKEISSTPPPRLEGVPAREYEVAKIEDCECSPCSTDESKSQKTEDSGCSCEIQRPQSPQPRSINHSNSTCECDICTLPGSKQGLSKNGSIGDVSLKSMDLFYMQTIQDLAIQQKKVSQNIVQLEQKARIFEDVFKEYKNVDFSNKQASISGYPPVPPQSIPDPNEKTNAELKLENFLLQNELREMRLEVRQYLERMEGPMQFKIESERYKVTQMENKYESLLREFQDSQDHYQNEINCLNCKLCTAQSNAFSCSKTNEQMMRHIEELRSECDRLNEAIIQQKISEADTLKKMKRTMELQSQEPTGECELHDIARQLSKVLRECEPCGDCVNLPKDLTSAAKLLKSLTDLVDHKIAKTHESAPTMDQQAKSEPLPATDVTNQKECKPEHVIRTVIEEEIVIIREEPHKKDKCKCDNKEVTLEMPMPKDMIVALPPPKALVPSKTKPSSSRNKLELTHQVMASKSKDILRSSTSFKQLNVPKDFPFDVDTQVDMLNKAPDGVHVTTTITKSGTLEVITEGPDGLIETTLVYTDSGNVEVVTEIQDFAGGKTCNRGKIKACGTGALMGPDGVKGADNEEAGHSGEESTKNVDKSLDKSGRKPNCKCPQGSTDLEDALAVTSNAVEGEDLNELDFAPKITSSKENTQ